MAWNNQGGPWGSGGSSPGEDGPKNSNQNPWGKRGGGGGPPDLDDLISQGLEKLKRLSPFGTGGNRLRKILLSLAALLVLWAATGFYRVNPDEQGIELLFGRYVKTTAPGLNYWFPSPIGSVITPQVTVTQQLGIGFRGDERGGGGSIPQESLVLTGDQNIIDVNFIVQWRIRDAGDYLFNISNVKQTVKIAAESAMREVIGQVELEYAMTSGRNDVATRAHALLQQIMDSYQAGVTILDVKLQQADPPPEVIDAFNDVQRARQDMERLQNEAQAYRNDIVPRARGEAERMIQQATGYKEQVVKDAEGEAARFLSIYETYKMAKDVTTQRLYLETMQDVLKGSEKVLIDGVGQSGVVPYLPLPELGKRNSGSTLGQETSR